MADKTNKPDAPETFRPNRETAKPEQKETYKDGKGSGGVSFTYLKAGQTIQLKNKYEVINTISIQTGEAFIYLCKNITTGKKVILKLYNPGNMPKKEILDILIETHHEDIINVYEYGDVNGQFCEVMEFAEGGNLEERLKHKLYTDEELKEIIKEIINGIVFLHSHNIVHRDIKPSNIFYRYSGERDVILGDIGTASVLGERSQHITKAALSLTYAPPEAYGVYDEDRKTNLAVITKEADFYSLGITLLCLLGRNPFSGLNATQIQHKKIAEKRESLISEDISHEFKKLLKGLLTKVQKDRWKADEIERWLRGEDVPIGADTEEEYANRPKMPPYKLGDKSANTPENLAELLQTYTDAKLLKERLARKSFSQWLESFDQNKADAVSRVEEKVKDPDLALFEISCILDPYVPYFLTPDKSAETPQKLAELIDKNWELGKKHFQSGRIDIWLKYTPGGEEIRKLWRSVNSEGIND